MAWKRPLKELDSFSKTMMIVPTWMFAALCITPASDSHTSFALCGRRNTPVWIASSRSRRLSSSSTDSPCTKEQDASSSCGMGGKVTSSSFGGPAASRCFTSMLWRIISSVYGSLPRCVVTLGWRHTHTNRSSPVSLSRMVPSSILSSFIGRSVHHPQIPRVPSRSNTMNGMCTTFNHSTVNGFVLSRSFSASSFITHIPFSSASS